MEDFEFTRLGIFPVYTFHILFSFTLSISFQLKLQIRRVSHYVYSSAFSTLISETAWKLFQAVRVVEAPAGVQSVLDLFCQADKF